MNASELVYLGLYALQHRGQESAGIAASSGTEILLHKAMGLVGEVFTEDALRGLPGRVGIGHVRYSTTGGSRLENAQPLLTRCRYGQVALAHNGNLVNTGELFRELIDSGAIFQSTLDSELILHRLARSSGDSLEDAVESAVRELEGAYALVIMGKDKLIGLRDPYGVRPLCLGKFDGGYVISSESCGISSVDAEFLCDIQPGQMVVIDDSGLSFRQVLEPLGMAVCAFEFIYFARPDSNIDGLNVHLARKRMGYNLAREHPVEADMVIAAPDSGVCAAIGFAEATGIPFDTGLIRNRYVGRTFIQPSQEIRELGVKIKLNPISDLVRGKRIVMVDDSIVRGTTSRKTVEMLRSAGAREVHMYVASPPVRFPCYYGIDTSRERELIASSHSVEEIRELIGADTLCYLSLEGLEASLSSLSGRLCLACLSGRYPIKLPEERATKDVLEIG